MEEIDKLQSSKTQKWLEWKFHPWFSNKNETSKRSLDLMLNLKLKELQINTLNIFDFDANKLENSLSRFHIEELDSKINE